MTDDLVKRLREMTPQSPFAPTENFSPHAAADRIEALERELEETQDRANAFATKEYYTEMRAERAEARLAKAVEALRGLVQLNDDYSPFVGELFHDRAKRTWDRTRAVLAEIEGGKKDE